MVLRALLAFFVKAALLVYSQGALLRTRRHSTRRQICKFDSFRNGQTQGDAASDDNVVFRSNDVLVVQERSLRIMVFARKGGRDGNSSDPYCHEQAEVDCGDLSTQSGSKFFLQNSEGGDASTACDSLQVCNPETNPDLSYLRSMIGGAIVARRGEINRIASIGLGSGTIPLFWSRVQPNTKVEAIDISGDVIAAAPCFGVKQGPNLQLIEEDGRKYLENQKDSSYDVIFMDAFTNLDMIPPCLKTVEFFKMISKKLVPGGVLSMNVWPRELDAVYAAFSTAFPERTQVGQSPGLYNVILLGRAKGGASITLVDDDGDPTSAYATGLASARTWAVEAEFGHGRSKNTEERILQDADACPYYAKDQQVVTPDDDWS